MLPWLGVVGCCVAEVANCDEEVATDVVEMEHEPLERFDLHLLDPT